MTEFLTTGIEEIRSYHLVSVDHRWGRFYGLLQTLANNQVWVLGFESAALVPDIAADVDKFHAVGRAVVGQGYYAELVAVAGNGSDFLEVIRVLQVLFRPGEEVEVGRHGVVEVEPAFGITLDTLLWQEVGENLVCGVADVEAVT
ncbi:MAG: hypothetical protein LQ348_004426 [Seirophora lacunosa]|nr:MAG: hypothetical protein LQ348_004426 [Seirophora lacunosa]